MKLTPKTNSHLKLRFALTPSGMERVVVFEVGNYNMAKLDVVTGSKLVDKCNSEGEDYTCLTASRRQGFGFNAPHWSKEHQESAEIVERVKFLSPRNEFTYERY